MARLIAIALCACGAAAGTATTSHGSRHGSDASQSGSPIRVRDPVDPIAVLSRPPAEVSWLVPGPAQLELGGPSLQAIEGAATIEVVVLEQPGRDVRVGVRLDHVRFALWTARARMLALAARQQRVSSGPGPERVGGTAPVGIALRAHARVRRLARKDGWTQIRYIGAIEVEGWMPDDALTDRGPPGRATGGRIATGRKTMMVTPGTVIRSEPRWAARQLAVMNEGYFLDELRAVDEAWVEIGYEDGDVSVRGYVSRRDPPGRVHRRPAFEAAPATLVPNGSVADRTCLHASMDGEPIGFVVGDRPALVEEAARAGWFAVSLDTPWGPIAFAARGSTAGELETCG